MSFRNTSNVSSHPNEDFHAMKDTTPEADYSIDSVEEKKEKRKDHAKKFLFKKESKDKGYSAFTGEASQDSVFLVNTKTKKSKPDNKITSLNVFKKSFKEDKRSKEEPKRSKHKKERGGESTFYDKDTKEHLFGNYLENAVASFPCNDNVKMPAPIRICIDIIEQKGIEMDIIYRRSVNKSLLETICDSINNDKMESRMEELNGDPNLACALIKKFLRELKVPLINDEILNMFDKCDSSISDKDVSTKIDQLKRIIGRLPVANRDTFTYLIMHFHRVLNKSDVNKIEVGLFIQKFHPMFRIRDRLFKFIIIYADMLFSECRFKKYRVKAANNEETISRFSTLPDSIEDLEQEIAKQESYLAKLHTKIANEEHSADKTALEQLCDELWALQRYVTSLKRKVKKLKLERKAAETEQLNNLKEAKISSTTQTQAHAADAQSSNESNAPQLSNSQSNSEFQQPSIELQPIDQLMSKEVNLVCENLVLIENIQQLAERINKEKKTIADLQHKLQMTYPGQQFNGSGVGANVVLAMLLMPDPSNVPVQELIEREQMIFNENKLLEERINLINKRINAEKDKIFELKFSVQLKTMDQQVVEAKKSIDLGGLGASNNAKMSLPTAASAEKDLIMTKL